MLIDNSICYNMPMIRGDTTEELEHLEEIAKSLGRLLVKAQTLPLTVDDISSWKQELDTLVLDTDQLDLHAKLMASSNAFDVLTPDNCSDYLRYYMKLIIDMREQLYHLKSINRSAQSRHQPMKLGDYELLVGGRILFRNKEITFGGKLREVLVAFLLNDEHVLTTAEIARIWGDDNVATVSRHKCKLDDALVPYYGDGHKHVNRVRTNPTAYKLDIG